MSDQPHYLYSELYLRLQSDESLFTWFEQGATDGMWYWDLEHPEQEWLSPRFKSIFGYKEDEIPHTSEWWQANIFPEDLPGVLDNFEKHKADPSHPYDQIVRYRHKTGKTIWVRCRGLIIRNEKGEPSRMLGAHTDLTSLMEARLQEEKVQHSLNSALDELNEINRLALATADIGLWRWDIVNGSLIWDKAMYGMYQIAPSEGGLNIDDWWSRVHPDDKDDLQRRIEEATSGAPYRTTFRIVLPDGTLRYLKAAADVYFDDAGQPVRMRGANWDITEEKQRELELERSNRDLSTFAYVASHDLKAPLRGIKQLASWIAEDITDPSPEISDHIRLMQGRVERLESLLDDLLAYSRAGQSTELKKETINTEAFINELFESLVAPAGCELITSGTFTELYTEKALLEQVVMNLLGNAIKHRSNDTCQIRVRMDTTPSGFRFHFFDNNTPIDNKHHKRIFEMFQTLRPRDEVEGSGMGLAITRRIVHEKGGEISLTTHHDEKQSGNEFIFTWPKG